MTLTRIWLCGDWRRLGLFFVNLQKGALQVMTAIGNPSAEEGKHIGLLLGLLFEGLRVE